MFGFVKKVFFTGLAILSSFTSVNSLVVFQWTIKSVKQDHKLLMLMEMRLCLFPFGIKTSKCSSSCNKINHLYAKICVPNVVKNLNVKLFNLRSRTNETRHIEWNEKCKCECKFGANVCNNKQRCNKDKCRCECKELADKGVR